MLSRKRIHEILEVANPGDRVSRLVDLSILALILLNITAMAPDGSTSEIESKLYTFDAAAGKC